MRSPISRNALAGYKVLDFSQLVDAPTCAVLMAEFGADVVHLRIAEGVSAGRAALVVESSLGTSVLRTYRGRADHVPPRTGKTSPKIKDLIRKADVIVGCFTPEVVGHLGLDHRVVRSINPRAVMCSVAASPPNRVPAKLSRRNGSAAVPAKVAPTAHGEDRPCAFDTVGTGAKAVDAICAALLRRERTGLGQYVELWSLEAEEPALHAARTVNQFAEFHSLEELRRHPGNLRKTVIKGIDLSVLEPTYWSAAAVEGAYFLGCRFVDRDTEKLLAEKGAILMPRFEGLAYDPYRRDLYTQKELEQRLPSGITRDDAIYRDYLANGRFFPNVIEALARRIHDDSMNDGVRRLVDSVDPLRVVGIMGWHSKPRSDPFFRATAETARLLALNDKFVICGGGPGLMEAANFGAYMASYGESEFEDALEILAREPGGGRDRCAREVTRRFPRGHESLAIHTWFFSQPTNLFARYVAKYFDNDMREGQLVQNAQGGIVFTPGGFATRQEIFADAFLNHHSATGVMTAMVFLGRREYEVDCPVYPLLRRMSEPRLRDMLFITDSPAEAVQFITDHPPVGHPLD
jgi:predicted Rossmann-fold nucleotide-binding protein